MIQGLMVLDSAQLSSRDLWWVDDVTPGVIGYNIYRAYDTMTGWVKINTDLVPGHSYRDMITLTDFTYTIQTSDWVEFGQYGRYIFKVPDNIIYSSVNKGLALLATSPDDVIVTVDGVAVRPAVVNGLDGTVWLPQISVIRQDGGTYETPLIGPVTTNTVVQITYKKLTNFVDIYQNLTRTYYTVVSVLEGNIEQNLPGAPGTPIVDTMQVDKMDYMQAEMVRRNAWLFEQVGEPAYLMFRRTKGQTCGCVNPDLKQARTGCPSCYETGIVGGYYGPIEFLFIDPDTETSRILEEGGVKVERTSRSYLGPSPIIQSGDLIVRRNGERLVITGVTYKTPRGVLLQQDFDVQLLPARDTRYQIPLWDPNRLIQIYNPAFGDNPQDGNEPVSDPTTDPTKTWENPEKPVGRTTTFGRIQT